MLGAGAYGTALGGVLAENGYDVDYYDPLLSPRNLDEVISESSAIISAVPSSALPELIKDLPKDVFFITATKGFLTDQVFTPFNDWAIISGPGFAEDIKAKKETILTVTDDRIIKMFTTSYLHFDSTSDRRGVLMCGSLKNIYALLAGLIGIEKNTKEYQDYLEKTIHEMQLILAANEANPETVKLSCGIGDLESTISPKSRNYSFGQALKNGSEHKPNYTVEGLSALERIKNNEIIVPDGVELLNSLLKESDKWN